MKVEALPNRVDIDRFEDALDAVDYLVDHHNSDGEYEVENPWGPEGRLYRGLSAWVILDAYSLTGKKSYLNTAINLIEHFKRTELNSGGWAMSLGENGQEFQVSDEVREDTALYEDPPVTASLLRTVSLYESIVGDGKYDEIAKGTFEHLNEIWDPEKGSFWEDSDSMLLKLRSNPNSYHLYFLLALAEYRQFQTEDVDKLLPKLIGFVKNTFESYDETAYPLMNANHMTTLMQLSEKLLVDPVYINQEIKPRLDQLMSSSVFKIEGYPGAYGHHDGVRGIVTTEAHLRNSCGVALAMKTFDRVMNTKVYTSTERYQDISSFIDSMKAEKGYYEYLKIDKQKRLGHGSPGQFIPCWWIFGKI
ncbi:hypothetical protein [Rhodohalobacter sulfatireducens]|uniref:Uncharacterized protein n=1 Tax=Rhodohalobacter sulfatireducens TaxID=2911366 RepID=A0ABS9KAX6_9BACT|nr:hypothetical protein [Rhodohalobacter sulfatireducens]MCG2587977.1 hypothetical protein [Rhodohalobacter sulfatireducens]